MKISLNCYFVFCIAILIVISLNPYFVWGWMSTAFSFALFVSFLFSVFSVSVYSKRKFEFSIFFSILIFTYSILNKTSLAGGVILTASIALLCSVKDEYIIFIFKKTKYIFAILMLPGVILWVVHHLIGFDFLYLGPVPVQNIANQIKVDAGQGYALYPFAVVMDYMLNYPVYRFIGILDEPGAVGTVCALMLTANKFSLRGKDDFIILLSGFLSFSLAFYILIAAYCFLISLTSIKKMLIFVSALFFLIVVSSYNESVNQYIFSRLAIDGGGISGDNRSNSDLEDDFVRWIDGSGLDFILGVDDYIITGASSWKEIPVKTGLFGAVLFLIIFSCLIVRNFKNLNLNLFFLAFIFIFFLSVYQRPYIVAPFYILVFSYAVVTNSTKNLKDG